MSIARPITGISKADSTLTHLSQPPPTLTVPADVPAASTSAIQFLEKITETDLKSTFFEDELVTYIDWPVELGFYKASVSVGCYRGDECIVVEASSEGRVEDVPCSTRVTAYLDAHLRTLHQELVELVQLAPGALDRRTELERIASDRYRVRREVRQGGEPSSVVEREFGPDEMPVDGYVSEAANIVLQRLLVTKGLPDYFEVVSLDADANLCQASYKDLALARIAVGPEDRQVDCWGIARRLHSVSDVPVTWHTYFLGDGHLVSRAQAGSPILMKVRELPSLMVLDEFLPTPIAERTPLRWQDDMQLTAMFRDRQQALASASRQFLRDHPEVRAMLADFLQALLAHKPTDVIDFSRHFFASFSNRFVFERETSGHDNRDRDTGSHLRTDRDGLLLSDM